jgi:hypothetical protein
MLLPNLRGICVTIDESTLGQIPVWRRAENVRSEPEAGLIGAWTWPLMKASGHVETLNGPFRHQRTAKAPQFAALGARRVHQLLHRTRRGRNSTVRQMRITAAWQMPAAPNIGSPSVPANASLYTACAVVYLYRGHLPDYHVPTNEELRRSTECADPSLTGMPQITERPVCLSAARRGEFRSRRD